jgi:Domain of unknown function (DUF4189)
MTVTSFQKRAAISAVGAAAVAALIVSVVPAAQADQESWGAIAVAQTGDRLGVSQDMPTESAANQAATLNCQQNSVPDGFDPNCNVMISFKYPECGAIVKNEDQFYRDLGATQQEAEQNAIQQSPKRTTKVLRSQCNDAPPGR